MDKFIKRVATLLAVRVNPAPAKRRFLASVKQGNVSARGVSRDSWIVMSMLLDLTALDITPNLGVV